LFAARAAVGIGEAAYGTISPALLADYFPRQKRGRVFRGVLCRNPHRLRPRYIVGGLVDHYFGWRQAFFVAGVPGAGAGIPGAAALRPTARQPGIGGGSAAQHSRRLPHLDSQTGHICSRSWDTRRTRSRSGALAFWTPTFLERVRGIPKAHATVQFGAVVVVTGFVGTYGGGWLGDRLLKISRQAYLWLSGTVTLLAAPLTLLALAAPQPSVYWPAIRRRRAVSVRIHGDRSTPRSSTRSLHTARHRRRAEHFHNSHPRRRPLTVYRGDDIGRALVGRRRLDHPRRGAAGRGDLDVRGVAHVASDTPQTP